MQSTRENKGATDACKRQRRAVPTMLCGEESRIGDLKSDEHQNRSRGRSARGQPRNQPKYKCRLKRKSGDYRKPSNPETSTQQPEECGLNPVTASTHVAEEIYIRSRAFRQALRRFQQNSLVVSKYE